MEPNTIGPKPIDVPSQSVEDRKEKTGKQQKLANSLDKAEGVVQNVGVKGQPSLPSQEESVKLPTQATSEGLATKEKHEKTAQWAEPVPTTIGAPTLTELQQTLKILEKQLEELDKKKIGIERSLDTAKGMEDVADTEQDYQDYHDTTRAYTRDLQKCENKIGQVNLKIAETKRKIGLLQKNK